MNITIPTQTAYSKYTYNNFSLKNNQVAFEGLYSNALNKLSSLSIDEYKSLSTCEKRILRLRYKLRKMFTIGNFENQVVPLHEQVADVLKTALDKSYGEGKYVMISIGRSLSSIAKVLSYRIGNENVKQIPLSYAGRFDKSNPLSRVSDKDLKIFKSYLESIGLTKDIIQNSGKKYIIMDYSCTGHSLRGAYTLLTNEKLLGKSENIEVKDIRTALSPIDSELALHLNYLLDESKLKNYSLISKSEELGQTIKAAVLSPAKVVKLTLFSIMDDMFKKRIIGG